MTPVLVDTGFIVARLDRSERYHKQCLTVLDDLKAPLITCEAVIVESYFLLRHLPGTRDAILQNIQQGILQIPFRLTDRAAAAETLLKKYADVPMDLADACLVDLATQFGTGRILTLDGDFNIYRWGRKRAFELLIEL
ncbi:MAG: PIN domain-containing protein [Planctomycetes bacterium]|nr:PIN domain-containing protein [Planctomycetota bacterium]